MDHHEIFKERLRSLRKERKETQVQSAEGIGIKERHYQKFEAGEILPSYENLWAIADHFGVSVDYLMGRSNDPKINK